MFSQQSMFWLTNLSFGKIWFSFKETFILWSVTFWQILLFKPNNLCFLSLYSAYSWLIFSRINSHQSQQKVLALSTSLSLNMQKLITWVLILYFVSPCFCKRFMRPTKNTYNVINYGARGNGKSDDSQVYFVVSLLF